MAIEGCQGGHPSQLNQLVVCSLALITSARGGDHTQTVLVVFPYARCALKHSDNAFKPVAHGPEHRPFTGPTGQRLRQASRATSSCARVGRQLVGKRRDVRQIGALYGVPTMWPCAHYLRRPSRDWTSVRSCALPPRLPLWQTRSKWPRPEPFELCPHSSPSPACSRSRVDSQLGPACS